MELGAKKTLGALGGFLGLSVIILFLARCGQLTVVACALTGSWTSVEEFSENSATTQMQVTAMGSSASGAIFAVGQTKGTASTDWLVRRSTDGGESWTSVDRFHLAGDLLSSANAIGFDSAGNIYVAGLATPTTADRTRWVVRKSTDGGDSWVTIDNLDSGAATNNRANAIAIAEDDSLFVGGRVTVSGVSVWRVRKSTNGGTSFTNVDTFDKGNGSNTVYAMAFDRTGVLFAAGTGLDSSNDAKWIVRRSLDAGTTWTTVDDFAALEGDNSSAYAIAVDSSGAVYVAGSGFLSVTERWIVRKSYNGTAWITIDNSSNTGGGARGIFVDNSDYVWVTGTRDTGDNIWVVRASGDGGDSWKDLDLFATSGSNNVGRAFAQEQSGGILAGGSASSGAKWVIRKMACQ